MGKKRIHFVPFFKYDQWAWPSTARPGVQKDASNGICDWFSDSPFVRLSWSCGEKVRGTKLREQNSAIHRAHAHSALLTDIARMLQTAVLVH